MTAKQALRDKAKRLRLARLIQFSPIGQEDAFIELWRRMYDVEDDICDIRSLLERRLMEATK